MTNPADNQSTQLQAKPKSVAELFDFLTSRFSDAAISKVNVGNEVEVSKNSNLLYSMNLDSRQINQGDVFVALQGANQHGLAYLQAVLAAKAAVVLVDRELSAAEAEVLQKHADSITPVVIIVPGLLIELGMIASWFYDYPSKKINVVGITGTNGKTSTAFYTAQLLDGLKQKVALMGTLGNGPLGSLQPTLNTTSDAITVQRLLADFVALGMQWCIMEVSSHALSLGRVQGVEFKSVAMTQVTRDHIDFHGTEQAYREAKKRLFTDYVSEYKIINVTDETGRAILQDLLHGSHTAGVFKDKVLAFNPKMNSEVIQPEVATLAVQSHTFNSNGIHCSFIHNGILHEFNAPLMGAFNLENLLCALVITKTAGFSVQQATELMLSIKSVDGRMQVVNLKPTVIIDFAHTPDALQQVLQAVNSHLSDSQGELKVVFGCGGDRDKGKRPIMGSIAQQFADEVVLTSDNPRSEEPGQIVDDILQGLANKDSALVELDRETAVLQTLENCQPEDIIVLAGKGHEQYQEIMGVKHSYSDLAVVEKWQQQN